LEVAEKCRVEIRFGKGAEHYPVFQPPETWTREGYLRRLLCDGLRRRYGITARVEGSRIVVLSVEDPAKLDFLRPPESVVPGPPPVEGADAPVPIFETPDPRPQTPDPLSHPGIQVLLDRLDLELGVIEKTGYVSYFLIVGDFVQHGRSRGIACVARGSAAGSLVTYLLEIANVDPLRYGLLFERFLNPERVSPPDIDIDFADDRRAEVIEYVRGKYGRDAVAQIITFGTMGAKSVLRDVARVMGLSFAESDRLAKMISDAKWGLKDALEKNPEFRKAYESEPVTEELVNHALILEDQARSAGVHAAGVVIGAQPLVNLLPLKQDDDGGIVTQYAMGPVGDLGLLKMDFLGLKTLTVLRNTVELVARATAKTLDLDQLPLDDAPTYTLLNNAQTLGVFQLESGGMRDLCKKFQIASVEHITALISLYRPGPMDLIPDFIRRRHGEQPVEYPHPLLEPIARETYGILIYQEQVMQAAQILAGYTLGGADLLRRAMGKKKIEEMVQQREAFVAGCAKTHQIPAAKANEVFDLLEKFAGYGFNKSHAAAYAIVAYQTAYLKANHPVEFLCAMMTNDQADLEKLAQYLGEAKGFGIEVLGPDVNESDVSFAPAAGGAGGATEGSPEARRIRFGLAAIKGVGEVAVMSILEARKQGGRFTTLEELCERVDMRAVNKKVLECLIKAGACDSLGANRATMMALLDGAVSRASSLASDRARGQVSLFEAFDVQPKASASKTPVLEEWPVSEKLAAEKELLGMYVSGHPLQPFETLLGRYATHTIESLAALENRAMARIGGLVGAVQEGVSKKSGKKYAMVTMEDLTGSVQLLLMNENYDRYRPLVLVNTPLLVTAEVNTGEDRPKLFPQEVLRLTDAPRKFTRQVHLRLPADGLSRARLEEVRTLVELNRGSVPLFLSLRLPDGPVAFLECHEHFSVTPTVEFEDSVTAAFGPGTYHAKADTALPERAPRKWERRNGGGEEG
ncbi:MAG: DNA polymerase III subunit alpha, partial [Verrucomicrobia bacterium]|nr:DNA polymerase III subunit alpha [Verrucomicrobiota bacterium]